MKLFDREALFGELSSRGGSEWVDQLRERTEQALHPERHGKLSEWISAWESLPMAQNAVLDASGDAVTVRGDMPDSSKSQLEAALRLFHPWRKGPFELFGVPVDTEWRSCLKWDRLRPHIDLRNKTVLDVGCGNGYYGWRMLNAGARTVVGLDPFLLFLMQFEVIRKYAPSICHHYVLPLCDADLPEKLHLFDVTFSMGVLYHRTSPIDHLHALWNSLVAGGTLVIETLVIEGETQTVLVPEDRYAKMRNVWFIPSIPMLLLWLRRAGFRHMNLLDVSSTTTTEQRRTDWMNFESLADFLDPADASRTVEGYPSPVRAIVMARRS